MSTSTTPNTPATAKRAKEPGRLFLWLGGAFLALCALVALILLGSRLLYLPNEPSSPLSGTLLWGISLGTALLFSLVLFAVLAPLCFSFYLLRVAKGKPDGKTATVVIANLIPLVILSLSFLLEYDQVNAGKPEGFTALISILILFLVSEMAAVLLSTVLLIKGYSESLKESASEITKTVPSIKGHSESLKASAKQITEAVPSFKTDSDSLKESASKITQNFESARSLLEAVNILKSYSELLRVFNVQGKLEAIPSIEELISAWNTVVSPAATTTGTNAPVLLRLLLSAYFAQEVKCVKGDLGGGLDGDLLPTPVREIARDGIRGLYLTTTVAFLSESLRDMFAGLSKQQLETENIIVHATITNVLPSWWWNWPRANGHSKGFYKPIADYREQLHKAVREGKCEVWRTILYAHNSWNTSLLANQTQYEKDLRSALFVTNESTLAGDVLQVEEEARRMGIGVETQEAITDTDGKGAVVVISPAGDGTFVEEAGKLWLVKPNGDGENKIDCTGHNWKALKSYYEEYVHAANSQTPRGKTEYFQCDENAFATRFHHRTDITFIGTREGKEKISSIWENQNWIPDLALVATMAPGSETLFLAVYSETDAVRRLWVESCNGVKNTA